MTIKITNINTGLSKLLESTDFKSLDFSILIVFYENNLNYKVEEIR